MIYLLHMLLTSQITKAQWMEGQQLITGMKVGKAAMKISQMK